MEKTPIAVALERQIPEFIREEYDLFVKFIKAYYEFLEQTQMRNLEDIGSIQNTLDEFIDRFKKQLSFLFPTNSLVNERFILQRIGEFYKTRGSKESFEFLFRALFNTQADIFYPSTQILRPSDGKWVQEKSVFVEVISGDPTKFGGKIISIDTVKKHLRVFCPRVSFYRTGIYEVFIEHNIVSDIAIDDVVSLTEDGVTHSGKILPCPTKYTIITEGLGFDVGSIHNLRSETGEGSVVKITRIGPNGEVKKIQVISFGLDYKSTFYAKLISNYRLQRPITTPVFKIWDYNNTPVGYTQAITSSTTITAVGSTFTEYLQAGDRIILGRNQTTGQGTNPNYLYGQFTVVDVISNTELVIDTAVSVPSNTPIYKNPAVLDDGNDGYVDYGYINKQDYFYYDANYSPSVNTNDAVFYVDATYVGEIVATFYTNAANSAIIDNSIAEVKIELGAVAVYPGYYRTNDGFVSDEMYIQDGKYYQIFSYVIKVEKQLDTFKDVVMNLLHPAGFEMFSEYTIKNNFVLEASPLIAFVRRQFFDQEFVSDSKYLEVHKTLINIVAESSDNVENKHVEKPLNEISSQLDAERKNVSKVVETNDSTASATLTSRVNEAGKNVNSPAVFSDIIDKKDVDKQHSTLQTIGDFLFYALDKPTSDSTSTGDAYASLVTLPKTEVQSLLDLYSATTNKTYLESTSTAETLLFSLSGGSFDKSVTVEEQLPLLTITLAPNELVALPEVISIVSQFTRSINDISTIQDVPAKEFTFGEFNDVYQLNDSITIGNGYLREVNESITIEEGSKSWSFFGETFVKSVSIEEQFVNTVSFNRSVNENASTIEAYENAIVRQPSELISIAESTPIVVNTQQYNEEVTLLLSGLDWSITGSTFIDNLDKTDSYSSEVSYVRTISESITQNETKSFELSGGTFNKVALTNESIASKNTTQAIDELINSLSSGLLYFNPYNISSGIVNSYFAESYTSNETTTSIS